MAWRQAAPQASGKYCQNIRLLSVKTNNQVLNSPVFNRLGIESIRTLSADGGIYNPKQIVTLLDKK